MGRTAQAQAGRDRARDARLQAAAKRRLQLDPDQLARERRIDEATVDVEIAWEDRARAEQALNDAEVAAATAIDHLVTEKLTVKDVLQLTGLDLATVRRLRQVQTDSADDGISDGSDRSDGGGAIADGSGGGTS